MRDSGDNLEFNFTANQGRPEIFEDRSIRQRFYRQVDYYLYIHFKLKQADHYLHIRPAPNSRIWKLFFEYRPNPEIR